MNQQDASSIAEAHLEEQRLRHVGLISVKRLPYRHGPTGTHVDGHERYYWCVRFAKQLPLDVVSTASSFIVIVDEISGCAEIMRTM